VNLLQNGAKTSMVRRFMILDRQGNGDFVFAFLFEFFAYLRYFAVNPIMAETDKLSLQKGDYA
jgi:hypothetical protein